VDRDHTLVKAAGASVNPTAVVVMADARLDNSYASIAVQRRVITEHDLHAALDAVLAGKALTKPETQPIDCYIQ
jgi:hypothetical protein